MIETQQQKYARALKSEEMHLIYETTKVAWVLQYMNMETIYLYIAWFTERRNNAV